MNPAYYDVYHIEKIIRDQIRSPSKVVTFPYIIINRHMSQKYTVYITNLVLDKVSCFNVHTNFTPTMYQKGC